LQKTEVAITEMLGLQIAMSAPLMNLGKAAVLALAAEKGVTGTYSCHAGGARPCGRCISCRERSGALKARGRSADGRRLGRKSNRA